MVSRFSFSVDGVRQLDRAFDRFSDQVKDWQPAWEQVGEFMFKHEEKIFSSRGFGSWAPLATGEDATLILSSRMKDSLTRKGADTVAEAGKDSFVFGTRVTSDSGAPYPLFHQRGVSKTNLPQRRVIFLNEEAKRDILKIMQRHAVDIVKQFRKDAGGKASVTGA